MLYYEDDVLKVLNEYGEMPKKLLYSLFPSINAKKMKNVISNLKIENSIRINDKYISTNSYYSAEDKDELIRHLKMVDGLWVLSKYLKKYSNIIHSAGEYPEQIAFVLNNQVYRIVVLFDGDLDYLKIMRPGKYTKYIVVVPNISDVYGLIVPSENMIFCTVSYIGDEIEPEVIFYTNHMEDADES